MTKLYGDGIHDDTRAIQERIDSGICEVVLPTPEKCYLISAPLELPSDFKLTLPRFAEVKLAAGANCVMLKNKTKADFAHRCEEKLWWFLNEYAPDYPCRNIEVSGGIWNCNNLCQNPNPIQTHIYEPVGYSGFGMLFYNVKNLILRDFTVKDPVNFSVTLDTVSYFTVENIIFDFNYGNPSAMNMDGIHLNGNCHFGLIRNLQGACYDDMVALNADEGSDGPITNIEIASVRAEDSHSAVRLLTVKNAIENIHIRDIYGTFYQYCVGITKYYDGESFGYYSGIAIENICASKAPRIPVYGKEGTYVFPLIWAEDNLKIRDLKIADLHRVERETPVETLYLGKNSAVENLTLSRIFTENETGGPMPLFVNNGTVESLRYSELDPHGDPLFTGTGKVCRQREY